MARIFGAPGGFTVPDFQGGPELAMRLLAEGRINLGMVTLIDAENLPPSALTFLQNAVVRFDRTSRRSGSSLFTAISADAEPVLKTVLIKLKDNSIYTIRLTPTTAYLLIGGTWVNLSYAVTPSGGTRDRFTVANVLDKIVLANNGVNTIQTIDFATNTIDRLGNAPAYRTVTGFFNRVVGFALRGTSEVEIGWCGDGNPTEWDPAVDESAGSLPLLESPDDLSDFVKIGFGFTNVMVVLREKSVWLANKQPIPTQPFYFYSSVPGIGCDCTYSARVIGSGLAWVDTRTGTVYAYTPGNAPESIGRPVDKALIQQITDPTRVFASYSTRESEYTVFVPIANSTTVRAWTFNFIAKAWTYNEYEDLTAADNPEASASGIRIQDLTGLIGHLAGSIEDLSPINNTPIRLFGFSDGRIGIEDVDANDDCDAEFDTIAISKCFRLPEFDTYVAKVVLEYNATDAEPIAIYYSTSGGDANDWVLAKTIIPSVFDRPVNLIYRRMIKCRRFAWKVVTRSARFSMRSYEVHIYQAGESKGS